MSNLNLVKIKVMNTNDIVYEFVFENNDKKLYSGMDLNYNYDFHILLKELVSLMDNKIYSNKLFNEWKILLFEDISINRKLNIEKSKTNYVLLKIINDLTGNILFIIENQDGARLYFNSVKIKDFELFLINFSEFHQENYDSFNSYSLDKFFIN